MAREVVFYSLAPKPAVRGDKTFAAAAAGKVSKGRKWYRLECRPRDVYQFPDNVQPEYIYDWLDDYQKHKEHAWAAFSFEGDMFSIASTDLYSMQGGMASVEHAIDMQAKGREGWVVFISEEILNEK